MKNPKRYGLILLLVFVGIQWVPTSKNQQADQLKTDFMSYYMVPKAVEHNLRVSCYDCHSNNTNYPWYSHIQPVAYFLENHIKKGKKELNFNTFGSYSIRRQKSKLEAIANQLSDGEMPLTSYTLIHRNAILSTKEKDEVLLWINHIKDSL